MSQLVYSLGYPDIPRTWEARHPDHARLIGCLWVAGVTAVLAGAMYWILGEPMIVAALAGPVVVFLALYHPPFGLFLLFACFALENAIVLSPYFTISKAMGILVALSFLAHIWQEKLIFPAPLKVAAVLIAWAFASTVWSMMPSHAAVSSLTLVLNAALILIVLNTVKDSRSLYVVVSGLAVGAFVASCMVLAGHEMASAQSKIQRTSLHEETNVLVLALAIGMGFIAVAFTFFQKGKFKKIIAVACLVVLFLAMVRTQSRMPILTSLSAPVIALILASKRQHRLKYLLLAIVVALVGAAAVWLVLQSDLLTYAEKRRIFSDDLESSGRLGFWRMGLQAFVSRPLHGYGTNNFFLIPGNSAGRAAHNTFVALAVDLGLVGFGLVVAIIVLIHCQLRSLSDIRLKWLGYAMLLYPLLTGMTVTNYIKREFWYSLAIAMAAAAISKRQEQGAGEAQWRDYVPRQAGVAEQDSRRVRMLGRGLD